MQLNKIEVENPGQRYISNWIIYSALGEPEIKPEHWSLKVTGLVKKPLTFSFEDLKRMDQTRYVCDFNCVTAWSIKDVKWEGPSLGKILKAAEPHSDADWVMFKCAEGYTTPVPLEYAIKDDSIIALKMNGNYLTVSQGFPARPFIPELYGWKSAKWLTEIEVIKGYEDGYWEQYGYHERGLVSAGERYTGGAWKRVRKTVTGMFRA
ncbi:MAG: sulfite oxidase-like oxidoreductase [Thermoplasmataceae archaeon]